MRETGGQSLLGTIHGARGERRLVGQWAPSAGVWWPRDVSRHEGTSLDAGQLFRHSGLCRATRASRHMASASVWWFVGVVLLCLAGRAQAVVTLESNGYRGIVVAIHGRVPQDPQLVQNLKELFLQGSEFLYEATRHRAYFNEVTIVVPGEWQPRPEYETVRPSNRLATADVRIDLPNAQFGNAPYTLQPGGCGEEGDFVHLTPDFVSSLAQSGASAYGDPGRALVHEWAHLRYGVFDEHGYQHDSRTPPFYVDEHGQIRYTACPADVPGWLRDESGGPCHQRPEDGLPDDNCMFFPDMQEAKGSLMAMPFLPSVEGFCDNSDSRRHNALAPNLHNLMCVGRSTWDVLLDHPDFAKGRNSPREGVPVRPSFRVVQPKLDDRPAFVLVLDVSASMRGRRMELLHRAAARFIRFQLSEHSSLGMVAFSTDVHVLSNMTHLDAEARAALVDRVPVEEDTGYTAIGRGLLEGLQVLRRSREPTEGSLLLLVTDGEENEGPRVDEVLPQVVASKVRINTIAFGPDASRRLEALVRATGGRGFFFDDKRLGMRALDAAFLESATTQADIELQPIEVVSRDWLLETGEEISSNFTLDPEIGTNTVFLLTYDFPDTVHVALVSPSGKKYDAKALEYTDDTKTNALTIILPFAEPGVWTFYIRNQQTIEQEVAVTVTSEARDIKEQPVRVRAWVANVDLTFPTEAKVYAEVKKEYNAVVGASVLATIDGPGGEPHVLMLYDNGRGADSIADDGIYSGYFTNFNGSGRYSVEAVVINNGKAQLKLGSAGSPAPEALPTAQFEEPARLAFGLSDLLPPSNKPALRRSPRLASVPVFERVVAAGSFHLQNWTAGDHLAPNQVIDLRVTSVEVDRVTLQWTWPGDDLDQGVAHKVHLRVHTRPTILQQAFDQAHPIGSDDLAFGSLDEPPEGSSVQVIVPANLTWGDENPTIFFALRAEDEVGNISPLSNLATALYPFAPPSEPTSETPAASWDPAWWPALAIAATIFLIALLGFLGILWARARRRQRKYPCRHHHSLLAAT